MKFNKKSLARVAILSAILGLNGMCFDNVVNGAEVAVEEAVVRNGKCKICGEDNGATLSLTRGNLCIGCIQENSVVAPKNGKIQFVLNTGFIKDKGLTYEDGCIIRKEIEKRIPNFSSSLEGYPRVKCDKCGSESLFTFKSGVSMCYNCFENSDAVDRQIASSDPGAIDFVLTEKFIKDYGLTEEDWKIMNESFKEMANNNHVPGFRVAKDGFTKDRIENKNPDEEICPICCDNSEKLLILPCCGNKMCRSCVVNWNLRGGNTCPSCSSSGDRVKRDATNGAVTINRKLAWNAVVELSKKFESQKNDDEFKKELEKLEGKVIKLTQEKKEEQERISHGKWYKQQKDEAVLNGLKDENIQAAVSELDKYTELEQRYSNEMDTVKSLDADREDWTNIEKNWDKYVEAYQSANDHHEQLRNML